MSPASSAATCAAGSLMKRKVTLLELDRRRRRGSRRHLISVTDEPLAQLSNLNGPGADRLGRGRRRRSSGRGSPRCSRPCGTGSCRRRCSASGSPCAGRACRSRLMLSNTAFFALLVRALGLGALEAELHVAGVEGLAVVELHALAQLEGVALPSGSIVQLSASSGVDAAVDVDLGQALEHVVVHDLADRRGRRDGRVEARAARAPCRARRCPCGAWAGGARQRGGAMAQRDDGGAASDACFIEVLLGRWTASTGALAGSACAARRRHARRAAPAAATAVAAARACTGGCGVRGTARRASPRSTIAPCVQHRPPRRTRRSTTARSWLMNR